MKNKLLLLLSFVVSSCLYSEIHLLDSDDLTWLSPYEQGDIILFKSGNSIDTMIVKEAYLHNTTSRFMRNESSSVYNGNGGFHCFIHHGKQITKCNFAVYKNGGKSLSVHLIVHKRFYMPSEKDIHFQKVNINGINYDDAIVINDTNSENPDDDKTLNMEYFIYSKSEGLLKYKYLNGGEYTFYKKKNKQD